MTNQMEPFKSLTIKIEPFHLVNQSGGILQLINQLDVSFHLIDQSDEALHLINQLDGTLHLVDQSDRKILPH